MHVPAEPELRTSPPRTTIALTGLSVALVFCLAVTRVTTPDTFVHLSLGRWMAEHGQVPSANLLSFTQPDRPATDHEWLFQVGLYGVWQTVGLSGATLLKAGMVAAAFLLAAATARAKGSGVVVACAVMLVAAAAARFRFTLRPQVVAMLLLAAYLFLFERWRQGKPHGLLLLLPLQVLWANVHGSAAFGCGLMLACAAAESLRCFALQSENRRRLLWLWAVALALIPATMLNPNGVAQLTFPFSHAAAQSAMGLKELLQDRASIVWSDLASRHIFFTILAAGGILSLVGCWRRRDITEAGLLVGLLWASFHSERFIELFAVAAAPIVARGIPGLGLKSPIMAAAGLCLLAFACIQATAKALPFGLGVAHGFFPEEEVAWIQHHAPQGNLFNEFEHGGYVSWTTRRPVFLDSRGMPSYDPALVRAYVDAWTSRDAWRELLGKYFISVALVERRPLKRMFDTSPDWTLAHEGPVFSVYLRKPR